MVSSGTCSAIPCETPSSTLKSNGPATHRLVSHAARQPMAASSMLQTYVVGTTIAPALPPIARGNAAVRRRTP